MKHYTPPIWPSTGKRITKVVTAGRVVEVYETDILTSMPLGGLKNSVKRETRDPDSALRAKKMVRWLSLANGQPRSTYFFTATFADDVKDYDEALDIWKKFRRILKNEFPNVVYVAVPEVQPRSGRWHFHAVLCNLPSVDKMRIIYGKRISTRTGRLVYAWPYYFTRLWSRANAADRVHRANIQVARNINGICGYLAKYLTKDVGGVVPFGRRNYYSGGRDKRKPVVQYGSQFIPSSKADFTADFKRPDGQLTRFSRYVGLDNR